MTYTVLWWVPIEEYTSLKNQWNRWVPVSCTHSLLGYQRPWPKACLEHGHLLIGSGHDRLPMFLTAIKELPPQLKTLWLGKNTDDLLKSLRSKIHLSLPLPLTKTKVKNLFPYLENHLKTVTTNPSHFLAVTVTNEYLFLPYDTISLLEYVGTLLRVYFRDGHRKEYRLISTYSQYQWQNHSDFFVINQAQGLHIDSILSLDKVPNKHYLCLLKGGHSLPLSFSEYKTLMRRFHT